MKKQITDVLLMVFAGILSVMGFMSCGADGEDILNEDKIISNYISTLSDNYISTSTENGVSRVLFSRGDETKRIERGDSVYFYYVASYLRGSSAVTYDTNVLEVAKEMGIDTESRDFFPLGVIANEGKVIKGLDVGLLMCYMGEHSSLIFNSQLAYGSDPIGIVPPSTPIVFEIQIVKIKKNQ